MIQPADLDKARDMGVSAHLAGMKLDANPFPTDSTAHARWSAGWAAAKNNIHEIEDSRQSSSLR